MEPKLEKYASLFALIDKAGGVKLPDAKNLTTNEQVKIRINVFAFLFTIFYYVYAGMWKKGLALFGICLVITTIIATLEPNFANFLWVVTSLIFAMRANLDLYKEYKLGDKGWFSI